MAAATTARGRRRPPPDANDRHPTPVDLGVPMSRTTRRSRRGPVLVLVTLLLAAGAFLLWTRSGDTAPAAAGPPRRPRRR